MASQTLRRPTLHKPLIDTLVPVRHAALRALVQLSLGVLLMALLAQVRLELGPVPITGQTLGVLLIGAAYGLRLAAQTMLVYLLVGGLGFGVFSGAGAGWSHFSGTTAGHLLSFPVAAAFVGYLAQLGWDRRVSTAALAMLLGNALIYLPGLLWLGTFAGQYAPADTSALSWTLAAGLYPFIVGDLFKLALAAALLPGVWRLLGRKR